MRKRTFVAFFVLALAVFPAWTQEYPQALVQLLEERLKALKRLQQEDCSPLVSAATLARVRRTEVSIKRLFPAVAAQFDRAGWPPISNPEDASSRAGQVTIPEPTLQGQDSPSDSPSSAIPIDVRPVAPLEEFGPAVISENTDDSVSSSSTGTARHELSEAMANPFKPLPIELTRGGQALSYTVTDAAETILGTYLPGEVVSPGGLYLFYFRNTSDRPVDISTRNFTLVDQDRDKKIKVKSRAEIQGRANPFVKVGKALGGFLRNAAHLGNRGMRFGHSEESRPNPKNDSEIDADLAEITAVQVSGIEMDADDQSRIGRCLQELFVSRSDWHYWVQARVLSEYSVQPGEEIIRFVPTGGSNRAHRHILRFKSDNSEASLNGAEKGLR